MVLFMYQYSSKVLIHFSVYFCAFLVHTLICIVKFHSFELKFNV